ncbi:hypothetical protein ASPZODRAFT_1305186 [Penicilliopsis zonata CBS 506.65]|uniref:Uncharacterized protein n=1 Tax=Penicilliopsis zonata CBS 506.65 TaxID=1073090 RepID=A0A1L9S604_9EURO|nr:hypothetical protein ASPZODRAFT_1305186 [Penicilliopsis zonata CBS 506.65]OJJ42563.1 hypothetical protein ASPZODRAFT_1305186 [Penicilliopsis zonata CBS 506.65]
MSATRYQRLDEDVPSDEQEKGSSHWRLSQLLLLVYCVLSTTVLFFLIATYPHPAPSQTYTLHTILGADKDYMSIDHRFDSLWTDLNGSAVFAQPDPRFDGKDTAAALSMFHQLHCLASFRSAIQMAREGVDPGLDWQDNSHWPHCLDYMRKTVLCWADGTLERQHMLANGSLVTFIDGAHDLRKCGDSHRLINMMTQAGRIVYTEGLP